MSLPVLQLGMNPAVVFNLTTLEKVGIRNVAIIKLCQERREEVVVLVWCVGGMDVWTAYTNSDLMTCHPKF
jgi:hypothetical protein